MSVPPACLTSPRIPPSPSPPRGLQQNGDTLLVTGTVTAHGHTVGVDVLIDHLTHEGTGIRLHGRAEHLDRTAFGITGSRGMVGRYLDLDLDAFANHRPRQRVDSRPGARDSHPRTSRTPNQPNRRSAMAIAVHLVNTPKNDAREAYETAWRRIDEQGVRHPKGRQSHTAWVVDDVLHVSTCGTPRTICSSGCRHWRPSSRTRTWSWPEHPRPASCCRSSGQTERHHPCRSASPSPRSAQPSQSPRLSGAGVGRCGSY